MGCLASIRKALPKEYDEIYRMGFDVWGEGQTLETYLDECRHSPKYQQGRWYVLANEQGAFCSSLIRYTLSTEICGIGSIATAPSLRNKGFASKLITDALSLFEDEGIKMIFLFSDIESKFYEKLGFVALPRKHQHHQDSVCMVQGIDIESIEKNADFQPPKYF